MEDVPSTPSFRKQQSVSMAEAFKSLPAEYQPVVLPHLLALMDMPNKEEVLKSIQEVKDRPDPEMEKLKADQDFRERELLAKYAPERLKAEIEKIVSEALKNNVQSSFSAMQAGAQIAQMPQIAPIADAVMVASGRREPSPGGIDPNFPTAELPPQAEPQIMPGVHQNTSPQFPPVPQQADSPMQGIETDQVTDNLPS